MSLLSPAFLPSAPVASCRTSATLRHSVSKHPRIRTRKAHTATRRRTLCVAQEEKTQSSTPSHLPSDGAASSADRVDRARKARVEAERLELLAAKARLDVERAELQAERKRLELDKIKNIRQVDETRKGSSLVPSAAVVNPYDTPTEEDETSATVKIGPNAPQKLSAESLKDLLSAEFPRVSESDIDVIKQKLCGMDTFFVTEVDRSPFDERVVFRGNMRLEAAELLKEFEERAEAEGIAKRVRLFLLIDPKDSMQNAEEDQRPVLVALPSSALPNQTNLLSVVFSVIVGLAAFATTFSYGIGTFGLTPEVITQIAKGNVEQAAYTLPISVGTMALSLVHDFGHRVAAAMRDVKLGLPFFLPSLQIGNYGVITPLESYPKLRRDLFDVAVSGPLLGMACSLGALITGLVMSSGGEVAQWFPNVPYALFHSSILVGTIADLILPPGLREQATIAVHPLAVVGYTGLFVNALNLMPIGRLDGGRIVQALYGRVVAGRVTAITLLVQGVGSLLGNSPILLFWGLVCVFLQRESDIPCRNEVIEPDNTRMSIGLSAFLLMVLVLIPFPGPIGDVIGQM